MGVEGKVSVICPINNQYQHAVENVTTLLSQRHPEFEIIVCDDSDLSYYLEHGAALREFLDGHSGRVTYKYVARFDADGHKDYGLARARNFGTIAASGEFLAFLDQRITPTRDDVLQVFSDALRREQRTWFFGDKGTGKRSFVENFSAVRRCEVIEAGMFCERIDKYGGMTREIMTRFSRRGINFKYLPEAVGRFVVQSPDRAKKSVEIPQMSSMLDRMYCEYKPPSA